MNIPSHAQEVYKGINLCVYHWEQEEFDGSTKTYESAVRTPGVQIIATKNGKILLSNEQQPHRGWFYTPFGGLVNTKEEFLTAAQRELAEETGLTSEDWEEFLVHNPKGRLQCETRFFIARNCKETTKKNWDSGEDIRVLELDWDEFLGIIADKDFRNEHLAVHLLRLQVCDPEMLEQFKKKLLG
jgi:ADP-ribose pyrophosphatase YjhB (NUDIX family)